MSKEIKVDISPKVEAAIPPMTVSQMIFRTADQVGRGKTEVKVYSTPVGMVLVVFGPLGGPDDPHFACVGFADEPHFCELIRQGGDK